MYTVDYQPCVTSPFIPAAVQRTEYATREAAFAAADRLTESGPLSCRARVFAHGLLIRTYGCDMGGNLYYVDALPPRVPAPLFLSDRLPEVVV